MSRHLIAYILTAARRDRLMMTLALMIVAGASLAIFMGSAAVSEQRSFSIAFAAGALRFIGVIGITLFCCFYIRRAFDAKEVEFLLSRPISRSNFLFSHAAAFSFLAVVVSAVVILTVLAVGRPDVGGLMLWGFSVMVEFSVMAIVALFFSMVISSASGAALAALGFYALSRMMGVLLGIVDMPPDSVIFAALGSMMKLISVIIPRLDLMGQSSWLIYGPLGSGGVQFMPTAGTYAFTVMEHLGLVGFIAVQGIVFTGLLLAAAAYDFSRKQF